MRFPHARWTQENHVAGFVNESQRTQLPNLPIIQRWLKTEIELLEGFYEREMGQLQPRPQIRSPSCFHLAAQQLIEKVCVTRLFLRRLFQQVLQPCFPRLQSQRLQCRLHPSDRVVLLPPPLAIRPYAASERSS